MAMQRKMNRSKGQSKVSVKKSGKGLTAKSGSVKSAGSGKTARKSKEAPKKAKPEAKASAKKVTLKLKAEKSPTALKTPLAVPAKSAASKGSVKPGVQQRSATDKQGSAKKNSAAVAAAAAVQKVTARLSRRSASEATGDSVCREIACEGLGTTAGYCRLHYIKNWRKIKRKEVILKEGKLNIYIEELVSKYPEKYLEAIRQDLASDKEFAKVLQDLDLDESVDDFESEGSDSDVVIDSIKREFDDDTEAF